MACSAFIYASSAALIASRNSAHASIALFEASVFDWSLLISKQAEDSMAINSSNLCEVASNSPFKLEIDTLYVGNSVKYCASMSSCIEAFNASEDSNKAFITSFKLFALSI